MADELKYKVSIETTRVEADNLISTDAIRRVVELTAAIEAYNEQLREMRQAMGNDADAAEQMAQSQQQLRDQLQQAQEALARQNREIVQTTEGIRSADEAMAAFGKSTDKMTTAAAHTSLAELTRQAASLRTEIKGLEEEFKSTGEATNAQRDELERLKTELKATQTEYGRQQRELAKVKAASDGVVVSYNDLVRQNAALSAAMRALPLNDTTGELQALQAQYNANNEALKNFDVAMGNHQRNVGNYSSGMQNLGQILAALPGPFGAAGQSLGRLATATAAANTAAGKASTGISGLWAVIRANPIGIVLTLVTGLIALLTKVRPVTEAAERVFAVLGATIKTVTDFIGALITGTDLSTISLRENTNAALANLRAKDLLARTLPGYIAAEAQLERNIANLTLQLNAQNISLDEQLRLLLEIENQEQQLIDLRLLRVSAEVEEARTAAQKLKGTKEENEANARLAEVIAEQAALRQEQFIRQTANIESVTTLTNEAAANERRQAKERADEAKKIAAEQQAIEDAAFQKWMSRQQHILSLEEEIEQGKKAIMEASLSELDLGTTPRDEAMLASAYQLGEDIAAQTVDQAVRLGDTLGALEARQAEELRQRKLYYLSLMYSDEEAAAMAANDLRVKHATERAKTEEDIDKQSAQAKTDIAMSVANSVMAIGTSIFGKSKALSVAQAIMDTYAAANSAMKGTPGGPIVKGLAVAAVIAKGMANVKAIMSTKIGSGMSPNAQGGGASFTREATMQGVGANMGQMLSSNMMGRQPITAGEIAQRLAQYDGDPRGRVREMERIAIDARVDRRGLAIAVREGEQEIRTEQFAYV